MTVTFKKPPIIEFSLAAQFAPLVQLTNGHFGLFWNELDGSWTTAKDEPPILDQFEAFGDARPISAGMRFAFGGNPGVGRLTLTNAARDRVLHLQPTRFMLSWTRTDQMKPSYKALIDEFLRRFERFKEFVESNQLGPIQLNQWEITYVDSFAKGELWQSASDWSSVLPGLFGNLFDTSDLPLELENRFAQWTYEIAPQRGRLHIVAQLGRRLGEQVDSLLLTSTARGPIAKGATSGLRDGLDVGHETAVSAFLKVVAPSLIESWEPLS